MLILLLSTTRMGISDSLLLRLILSLWSRDTEMSFRYVEEAEFWRWATTHSFSRPPPHTSSSSSRHSWPEVLASFSDTSTLHWQWHPVFELTQSHKCIPVPVPLPGLSIMNAYIYIFMNITMHLFTLSGQLDCDNCPSVCLESIFIT